MLALSLETGGSLLVLFAEYMRSLFHTLLLASVELCNNMANTNPQPSLAGSTVRTQATKLYVPLGCRSWQSNMSSSRTEMKPRVA